MPKRAPASVAVRPADDRQPSTDNCQPAECDARTTAATSGVLACLSPHRSSRAPLFGIILHAPLVQQG
jgi:hypothetical protein